MKDLIDMDDKADFDKCLEEAVAKLAAIRKLPEFKEYLKWKEELDLFTNFVNEKRMEKVEDIVHGMVIDGYSTNLDEEKVSKWIERLKDHDEKLSDIQYKKGNTSSPSNVMDLVWMYFEKRGREVDVNGDGFANYAYSIGNYIMETFSGQGEYGYAIYMKKRIF